MAHPFHIIPFSLCVSEKLIQPRDPPLIVIVWMEMVDDRGRECGLIYVFFFELSDRVAQVLQRFQDLANVVHSQTLTDSRVR